MDQTREPQFELKVQRRGEAKSEIIGGLGSSGKVFELQEDLRQVVAAFHTRRPLVSPDEARKRIVLCLETECSMRENRVVDLLF